jgi:hypothetical protein
MVPKRATGSGSKRIHADAGVRLSRYIAMYGTYRYLPTVLQCTKTVPAMRLTELLYYLDI